MLLVLCAPGAYGFAEAKPRCFYRVLHALLSPGFREIYLRLPDEDTPLSNVISSNPKFYPFFKDAVGAIDGTHINLFPPEDTKARFRDRDGNLTQNVLAVCSFEMCFSYIMAGWEGSASDSFIFEKARSRDLVLPPGKYLIADAGFPGCDDLIVPYRGVRYHLREFGVVKQRYCACPHFT